MTADRTTLQNHGQDAKPSEETTRAALVERVAVALTNADRSPIPDNYYKGSHPIVSDWAAFLATAAIDLIRAEVLEEAARVADALEDSLATEWREGRKCDSHLEGKSDGAGEVAAAIRAALTQEKT